MIKVYDWLQAIWLTAVIWLMIFVLLELVRSGLIVQFGAPIVGLGILIIALGWSVPVSSSIPRTLRWLVPLLAGAILLIVSGITVWTIVLAVILLGVLFNFTNV